MNTKFSRSWRIIYDWYNTIFTQVRTSAGWSIRVDVLYKVLSVKNNLIEFSYHSILIELPNNYWCVREHKYFIGIKPARIEINVATFCKKNMKPFLYEQWRWIYENIFLYRSMQQVILWHVWAITYFLCPEDWQETDNLLALIASPFIY